MVVEGREGQIWPPGGVQTKDMLVCTGVPSVGHQPPPSPAHLCHGEDSRGAVLLCSLRWGCLWSADRPIHCYSLLGIVHILC